MSKEYIYKEKVLSELCSDCKGIAHCRVPCALYNHINDSSPADVKPVVRGEWIWDPYEVCYECGGYGDDYSIDENGEPVWNCPTCPCNPQRKEDENDE